MIRPLAFTDVETTHLSVKRGEVWEVGVVLRGAHGRTEHLWQIRPEHLDPAIHGEALAVNRLAERFQVSDGCPAARFIAHPDGWRPEECLSRNEVIAEIRAVLHDAILAANNSAFDDRHLREFLGVVDEDVWQYRTTCVVTRAEGYLWAIDPQWMADQMALGRGQVSSRDISKRLGVPPPGEDAHQALPDARWAEALYDAVPSPQSRGGDTDA